MFRAEAGPRPDSPMTTPPLQTPSGLEAGRARRFARAGAARAEQAERRLSVPEGDAPRRTIRNRDRWFRVAVTLADVAAALMVVGLSTLWTPTSHLGWTALLLPLLVPVVNAANGLYQRDARVLNKSTLDEAPVLFRAATMTALIAFLIGSGLLEQPLGAKVRRLPLGRARRLRARLEDDGARRRPRAAAAGALPRAGRRRPRPGDRVQAAEERSASRPTSWACCPSPRPTSAQTEPPGRTRWRRPCSRWTCTAS